MNCKRCSELLIDYLHEELGPERETVEEHLRSCAGCSREYEELREIRMAVSESASLPEPSPEVLASLSKAAKEKLAREDRPFWKRWKLSPILIPALSSAIALSVWFYYGYEREGYAPVDNRYSQKVMAEKVTSPGGRDDRTETRAQASGDQGREKTSESGQPGSSHSYEENEAQDELKALAPASPPSEHDETVMMDVASGKPVPEEFSSVEAEKKESFKSRPVVERKMALSSKGTSDYGGQLDLALRQQREGDCASSIRTNEMLLNSTPKPPQDVQALSYRSLAECYEKKGELDKAIVNYMQLQQVAPEEAPYAKSRILEIREKAEESDVGTPPADSGPAN